MEWVSNHQELIYWISGVCFYGGLLGMLINGLLLEKDFS